MKKLCFISFLSFLLATSIAYNIAYGSENFRGSIGVNPISLLYGGFNMEIEFTPKFEILKGIHSVLGFGYWNYSDENWDISSFGITSGFKKYFKKETFGPYIKGFFTYIFATAKYYDSNDSTYTGNASGIGIGTNIGYKWNLGNSKRIYISPEIGLSFIIINAQAENYVYSAAGIIPSGNIMIGYNF